MVEDEKGLVGVSLSKFIDDNHKIISVFGVFLAVAAFATKLDPPILGYALSFLFVSNSVLIWIELINQIPRGAKGRLYWFGEILGYSFFVLVAYCLLSFRNAWKYYLYLPVAVVIVAAFFQLLSSSPKLQSLVAASFGKHKLVRWLIIAIGWIMLMLLSHFVAHYGNLLIDRVYGAIAKK